MVHNGIEYGMLQAYGEGFEILHASDFKALDLRAISHLWNQGSVVRSCVAVGDRILAEVRDSQRARDRFDRFDPMPEAGDRLSMTRQFAVRRYFMDRFATPGKAGRRSCARTSSSRSSTAA
jgi:hypothetical protein